MSTTPQTLTSVIRVPAFIRNLFQSHRRETFTTHHTTQYATSNLSAAADRQLSIQPRQGLLMAVLGHVARPNSEAEGSVIFNLRDEAALRRREKELSRELSKLTSICDADIWMSVQHGIKDVWTLKSEQLKGLLEEAKTAVDLHHEKVGRLKRELRECQMALAYIHDRSYRAAFTR